MISKKRHAWRTLLIIPGSFTFRPEILLHNMTPYFLELEGELVVGDRNAASYAKVIALGNSFIFYIPYHICLVL